MPPSLGPGVYLGTVERTTSFLTDDLWYGIFAGTVPETFVRVAGAFIPFAEDFNMENVITTVRRVGEIGDVNSIDLQSPISSLIGRQVIKVGRSSVRDQWNASAAEFGSTDAKHHLLVVLHINISYKITVDLCFHC